MMIVYNTFRIFIFLLIVSVQLFAQGTAELKSFYSNALEEFRTLIVYTPEGYNPNGSTDYPVVYFLHGGGFNSYPYLINILDTLIGNGYISPIIFVQPDGTGGPYYGGFYTNSELNGNFEDYGAYDVVDYIDSNYSTISVKESRGIMGHSWGAYSCMKLALKYPDIFGAVASNSGTPDLNVGIEVWRPHVLSENGGSPPYSFNPSAGVFSISLFGWAGAFSPNLNNPPYQVDFPLDTDGEIVDSVLARWQQNNPAAIASQLPLSTNLKFFFDCGTNDEFECYPMNIAFKDTLDILGIPYKFQSYSGSHFNKLPERFAISLMYLDSVMLSTPVEQFSNEGNPIEFALYQNYPNPFNPSTTIIYQIAEHSSVLLKIYDGIGNEIATLVDEEKDAGVYEVEFNSELDIEYLPSGVYFFQLITDTYSDTKKMILLK